jgi:protein phosphatase
VDYLGARIEAVRAAIAADVASHADRAGMGSTVVAALVVAEPSGDELWLAHVGDSRAYLWDEDAPRERRLRRWTRDHSVAQLAVDTGTLTPLDALTDRRRHQLTRAVGAESAAPEFAGPLPFPARACLLLVSDGVCGVLPDEALASLIADHRGAALAEALRAAVLDAGAPDNLAIALLDRRPG